MKYFSNPKTEEELKNQYRTLLKKYDYRSEKNAPIIQEIKKEYEEIQLQIKRANGYRTVTEKIVDGAKDIYTDYETTKKQETERISQIKNHKYTKSEIQTLVTKTKAYISKMLYSVIKKEGLDYTSLRNITSSYDAEYVCRWFNTHTWTFANENIRQEYDNVREVLEYALKSQASDKKSQETYMLQMEKLIGNHIINAFKKYEDELVDPITIAEHTTQKYAVKKTDKKFRAFIKKGIFIFGIIYFIGTAFSILTNDASWGHYRSPSEKAVQLLFVAISMVVGMLLLLGIFKFIAKIEDTFNRKTLGGLGEQKRKSRVSERKQYMSDRGKSGLIQAIARFFFH